MANKWGKNGNSDFIFLGSKITADDDCRHEIKRDITLPTKVRLVKAMVFPVVLYGCGVGL